MSTTSHTVLTYQGFDIDIGNKNSGPLVLFLGETPAMEEVKIFVQRLYGDCKIVASQQKALQSTLEHVEPEVIQGNLNFVPKPAFKPLVFPELRPLAKTERDKEIDRILDTEKDSEKLKNAYMKQLVKKAEQLLQSLFDQKKKHEASMLRHELDSYRSVCREFGEGSRARLIHQMDLEKMMEIVQK
ncbi:hypothetical protein ABK040_015465 [Willaertia magna]